MNPYMYFGRWMQLTLYAFEKFIEIQLKNRAHTQKKEVER